MSLGETETERPSLSVLFVCDDYPPGPNGGIGSLVQVLGTELVRSGHTASVIGVYPRSWPAPDRHCDDGVDVVRIREPEGRTGWLRARLALRSEVARRARAGTIDLVEVPDYRGWAAGWPRLPVPVVARCNGSEAFFRAEAGSASTGSSRWIERRSLRRADHLVGATRYVSERTAQILGTGPRPWTILPNVVRRQVPGPFEARERRTVLFAGTLTEKKGVVELLRAWPAVVAGDPAATLELWGKDGSAPGGGGSMRAHLAALAVELGVSDSVTFRGHAERAILLDRLRQVRVAVFPSHAEAFGIAAVEAVGLGCPTIYTKVPPGPELLDDERHGLLVDPSSPDDIAGAVLRLLGDDELAATLARRGAAHVDARFTVEGTIDATVAFYREITGSTAR